MNQQKNPNLEYFNKNNIKVLFLTDPIDSFVIPQLYTYNEWQIVSIDKEDLEDNSEKTDEEKEKSSNLLDAIKEVLGENIADVKESKRLVDSPCTLVAGKDGMDAHTERMMKMMDKNFTGAKKIFEVNTNHIILENLSKHLEKNGSDDKFKSIVNQLYGSSLLIEGELKDPNEYVSRVYELIENAVN